MKVKAKVKRGTHLNHHGVGTEKVYSTIYPSASLPRHIVNGKFVIGKKHTPSMGSN